MGMKVPSVPLAPIWGGSGEGKLQDNETKVSTATISARFKSYWVGMSA